MAIKHIHTITDIYAYTNKCTHYTNAHILYTQMHTPPQTYIYTHTHTKLHTDSHLNTYKHMHIHKQTNNYAQLQIQTYQHTHVLTIEY